MVCVKQRKKIETCYSLMGVSSEIPQVSLCLFAQRGTHFYRRLRDKTFRRLFLSPPIDSFSGYFKKLTDNKQAFETKRRVWHETYSDPNRRCSLDTPRGVHSLKYKADLKALKVSSTTMPYRGGV